MSEIKISITGSESFTITGQTIDKLIRTGDGDAALLYLYILKTHGQSTDLDAAKALGKSKGWVASAMLMLSRMGLIEVMGTQLEAQNHAKSEAEAQLPSEAVYTQEEVRAQLALGSEFTVVVKETERKLGKILSPDELLRLFGIYDNLRLPTEVILQLITHCIGECAVTGDGRSPSVRYIEKAAYVWEREGIFSIEKAEEYLKKLEEYKSARGQIKKALQIRDREFSATEKRYVDDWISRGTQPDAVALAYDKTVIKTGRLAWPYMDTIIKSWDNKGFHTAQAVLENENGAKQAGGRGQTGQNVRASRFGAGTQKHGEPSRADMERMTRILEKIKEE
ncbi:MAG: DnaD domain protein [Oscillospiraceae bacterium]|nr:DnaD domain protein [Oscillospiraceae bacterium]